jgi:glycosyltransferase involved in cell wall biosynthesis
MKIGIVSPFRAADLAELLDSSSQEELAGLGGASATPVFPLAREWHRRGHSVAVFCFEPSASRIHTLRGNRLVIHVIPKRRARRCLLDFYRTECRLMRELVGREKPDVLTAQWTYDHALAALQCGIPTAVTCHDPPWRCAWIIKSLFAAYHVAVAWHVIRHADRLICVSPYTARHIQRYFRPRCPLDVVPNGLGPEVFARRERRLGSPAAPERALTLCNVGGWGEIKNVTTLLLAFALVRAKKPAAKLALFGCGLGPAQAAETWARHRNLQQGVVFNGAVPYARVLDFLEREAGLMVHPSLVEAHGMVLVEAMACGVPAIGGSRSGAVPWTLEEGRSGYLCDVRNPRALADTIIKAIEAPDRNQAMVEHAWISARQRFNQEQAAAANESILQLLWASKRHTVP